MQRIYRLKKIFFFIIIVSINVPTDDSLLHCINTTSSNTNETESLISRTKNDSLLVNNMSNLKLDDMLLLLYRLQQKTIKNSISDSPSTMNSSSKPSSHSIGF